MKAGDIVKVKRHGEVRVTGWVLQPYSSKQDEIHGDKMWGGRRVKDNKYVVFFDREVE